MEDRNLEINGNTVTIGQPCMRDKIIIACYFDITNVDESDVMTVANNITSNLDYFRRDGTAELIVIPIKGESRIECINPKLVSEKEYEKALKVVEDINELMKKYDNTATPNT